ncbi:unnamed protein product [Rotaria magnacalcarata]|uniref:Uncharacterized protein n=2 Tax=Rotaria magnacalcarata TaxID=392030 RepID=A0A814WPE1_9BILA|nr:unnamed protein product [Rotaria magnacalcarata]
MKKLRSYIIVGYSITIIGYFSSPYWSSNILTVIYSFSGYVENNLAQKTIELFNELKNPADVNTIPLNQMKLDDIQSSIPIHLSAIKAVSQIGDYSKAQSIVKQIPDCLLVENQIPSALIDLWVSSNKVVSNLLLL